MLSRGAGYEPEAIQSQREMHRVATTYFAKTTNCFTRLLQQRTLTVGSPSLRNEQSIYKCYSWATITILAASKTELNTAYLDTFFRLLKYDIVLNFLSSLAFQISNPFSSAGLVSFAENNVITVHKNSTLSDVSSIHLVSQRCTTPLRDPAFFPNHFYSTVSHLQQTTNLADRPFRWPKRSIHA